MRAAGAGQVGGVFRLVLTVRVERSAPHLNAIAETGVLAAVSSPSWFDGRTLCVLLTMRALDAPVSPALNGPSVRSPGVGS